MAGEGDRTAGDGLPRRVFLASTMGGVLGTLLARHAEALPRLVQAGAGEAPRRRAKSAIILWLAGGPSQVDTFDPKRHADAGPFRHIGTSIPGASFTEHLPRTAEIASRLVVVRSVTSKELNHFRGRYLMRTGYDQDATVRHPAFGSVVSKFLGDPSDPIPQFVSVAAPSVGAGILGDDHAALVVRKAGEPIDDLAPPKGVSRARFERRLALLDSLERASASPVAGSSEATVLSSLRSRALAFARSDKTSAFDLSPEPAGLASRYGDTPFGRGCLLARRLVERGVKCVEVTLGGWDTHTDNFGGHARGLEVFDPAFSALVLDLEERRLLESTIVLVMGEFGRAPKITHEEGRHHHGDAFSAVLAGGWLRSGIVHGASDESGDKVVRDPVTIPDILATLCDRLGIDTEIENRSPSGRPIKVSLGRPIEAILG